MIDAQPKSPEQEMTLPFGRIDQPFAEYFKENGIEIPPIKTTIFFGRHHNEADAKGVEPHYIETDVFSPERVNWKRSSLELWKRAAKGGSDAAFLTEDFISTNVPSRFGQGLMRIMKRNPGKEIIFVDLEDGTALSEEGKASVSQMLDGTRKAMTSGFSLARAAELHKVAIQKMAPIAEKREDLIICSIPKRLGELVRENPELLKKEEIKLLLQIGSAHSRLYHVLKKRGDDAKCLFDHMPLQHTDGLSLLLRAKAFDKQVSDEASQKIFFGDTITKVAFLRESADVLSRTDFNYYLERIVESFSVEETAKLFKKILPNPDVFQRNFGKSGSDPSQKILNVV